MTKPTVISFRITGPQTSKLNKTFKEDKAVGIKSEKQLARKILLDYLGGHLVYKNPKNKFVDLDQFGET